MRPLLLFAALFCLFFHPARAQQLVAQARQTSYLTKVFRLSDEQARQLYERGLDAARPEFFTQAVDSFPTDKPASRRLPLGYYLVAHTEGPQLVYELRTEADREVLVVDNQVDLSLVVRDSLGRLLPDAQVALRGKPLAFDAATQTYLQARGGRAGLVAVTSGGRTTFHALDQTFPRGGQRVRQHGHWLRRAGWRVLYGFPLGYLSGPVRKLVQELHYPAGVSTGPIGLLRSIFNEDVRDERQSRREDRTEAHPRWTSYVATSQPRYRPTADTLRLKARVLRQKNGRPYRRPLTLWLGGNGYGDETGKRIARLRPSRPGSYAYTLPLTDSLGLRPDTYVGFRLKDRRGQVRASGQFRLEDYELKNSHYTLRVAEKTQRQGQPQAVFVRGTDANDLNLLDARLRLSVTPSGAPGALPGRQLFMPDTLWTHRQALDALGETRLNLPANALPDVDFKYNVQATLLTSDNERRTESAQVDFRHDAGELHAELRADSVHLEYRHLGHSQPHAATLRISTASELGSGWLFRGPVQLPLALKVDAHADSYELRDAEGRWAGLDINEGNAELTLLSDRRADSLVLAVSNPHGLHFWYYLYQGNRLRYRGYADALNMAIPHAGAEPWFASLHYWWGDALRSAEFTMALPAPQLLISAEQPAVAYPGQRISLRYAVTDERGRPVPHADLTSYAYTSKFEQTAAPALPQLRVARPVQGRQSLRRFKLGKDFAGSSAQKLLPWARWRHVLGLDSLTFYQFLYPETGSFHEYRPAPGGLTQVAVFLVDSGRVLPPVAVYVDGQPGYIHDVNHNDPYTVVADSGFHTISVRTATRFVRLREVYLRPLHKLTLSIDVNHPCAELSVETRRPELAPAELLGLQRSVVVLDGTFLAAATLRQGPTLRPLTRSYYREAVVSGPFRPDSVLLRDAYGLRRKFLFEPLYKYSFGANLLKMQCLDAGLLGPLNGYEYNGYGKALPLQGFAYTEADFKRKPEWQAAVTPEYLNARLDVPYATPQGQGRLELRLPPRPADAGPTYKELAAPRYVLLTRPGQPKFLRLERGYGLIHALAPGRYRVAMLLADSSCLAPAEDVLVQPNGQTYFQLRRTDQVPAGRLSRRINQQLWLRRPKAMHVTPADSVPARREIRVETPATPQPGWRTLRGQVLDRASEEGMPGVTVLIKGTTMGTSTNADGSFALQVPPDGSSTLRISSVGYITQEVAVSGVSTLVIKLAADTKQLNEVVVVGYGTTERRNMSAAVSTVSAAPLLRGLAGQVAGVQIEGAPGARIMIRGAASISASNKPFILLNGLPFDGLQADIDPASITSLRVIKGTEAASLYGSQAANGAIIITTKGSADDVPNGADPRLALRRHFRDYAWWHPLLETDARGQARAEVVLPDDVTSWDSFVLASDNHGRLGRATARLKSFKQLRAELATPRFLVAGDRTQLLGKSLNYGFDTAQVTTTFRAGAQVLRTQNQRVSPVALDTLTFTAPAATAPDSVTLSFALAQPNGYQDGEQRSLPLLPAGTLERVGTFATLTAADTTLQLPINPALGEVTVHLESDALPLLLSEIEHLQHYAYLCNEQAASKLKALLLERRIREVQGQPFRGDRAVNFLIKKLLAGQHKPEHLWGTWPTSSVSPWATTHVLEALLEAEKAGYKVTFDRAATQRYLLGELDDHLSEAATVAQLRGRPLPSYYAYYHAPDDLIRLLALLHRLGAPADFKTYVSRFNRLQSGRQPLDRYLALLTLRHQLGLPYQLDTLRRYRLRTQLGGVFYGDTLHQSTYYGYLLRDRVGTTLLAYRALRAIGGHEAELARLRVGLLNLRVGGHWTSTYEAAEILETIGPDLFAAGRPATFARAQLSGGLSETVTKFPFTAKLAASSGPLTLRKEGLLPLYATAYQSHWNPTPAPVSAAFTVRTELAGQAGNRVTLRAGQPAELLVTVDVKAEARYVLLEVPIPAGCSYGDPAPTNGLETHREYLRHQTGIFVDYLPVGRHQFRIALQPRFKGTYTINPAKAELVYFPTKFGRSASKQAVVK
ncbi:carboxypeptidase-like regulatory domain-containing protein [Hymenobacter properus]|uniref:Carboxypeptidase-like regulatory domain-containing protein n=1 Tax=Hymenobacter properus TaxID=2791026 RepID=A0A931BEX6_9BACT|nr:carboxypeptidase-like regulatory domain-containing protein [Hymenobacter properus]MBF9142640.1 carboxypeptidase-like regulatory domain-containing protein [Hymenobacter properus]MBR7721448.1 carboxypeptidase-like regulatory domain-containing protein [Microvirga sp. SRT04]